MKQGWKIAIVLLLVGAVGGTFALRSVKRAQDAAVPVPIEAPAPTVRDPATVPPAPAPKQIAVPTTPPAAAGFAVAPAQSEVATAAGPSLLEFGSNRCMACQQMAVVLDALRASQGAKLRVEFFDVMENPELGEPYKISLIPTQVFVDAAGKEIYRHIGFFSHDDILAKFRELGVRL